MNFKKLLLLTLLLLPAASWAMETDGFEPWKAEFLQPSEEIPAPPIFQILLRAAAKELNIPTNYFVPTVFIGNTPGVGAFTLIECNREGTVCRPARIFFKYFASFWTFPLKKAFMLHEMAHVLDLQNVVKSFIRNPNDTAGKKACEHFAETQMITHLKCFKCAKEVAFWQRELFFKNTLKTRGYFDRKQAIELAQKTYGTSAQCPYHKEWAKRRPTWYSSALFSLFEIGSLAKLTGSMPTQTPLGTIGLFGFGWYLTHKLAAKNINKTIEQEVADGKLEV